MSSVPESLHNLLSGSRPIALLASLVGLTGYVVLKIVSYFKQDVRKLNGPVRALKFLFSTNSQLFCT